MIDLAGAARELVARTTAEQGLPVTIVDEATLRRVATLIARNDEGPPKRAPDTLTSPDATTVKACSGG